MKPPIIVDDSGDVSIFDSIEAAESYLEPHDDPKCVIYDSQGRMLKLSGSWRWFRQRSRLESDPAEISNAESLRSVLVRVVTRFTGPSSGLEKLSTEALIEKARPFTTVNP